MTIFASAIRASVLAAAIALAGCAAKPDPNSFGGRLMLEGGEVAEIGDNWNKAQQDILEGQELIEDGEDQIRKGRKQIARGEDAVDDGEAKVRKGKRMISDGEKQTAAAEAAYERHIIAATAATRPK